MVWFYREGQFGETINLMAHVINCILFFFSFIYNIWCTDISLLALLCVWLCLYWHSVFAFGKINILFLLMGTSLVGNHTSRRFIKRASLVADLVISSSWHRNLCTEQAKRKHIPLILPTAYTSTFCLPVSNTVHVMLLATVDLRRYNMYLVCSRRVYRVLQKAAKD